MNYFAHGRHFVQCPFTLAGTAVPDWLSVVNRRVRVRSQSARPFLDSPDRRLAELAQGIMQHHHDDRWFHGTRAFAELSLAFTCDIRQRLAPDPGMRPSFLGHILVELLLDAVLIADHPARLDAYYATMDRLDGEFIAWAVNQMAPRPVAGLEHFIPLFSAERFLYDYAEDAKLLGRLNRVMRRVHLPPLPDEFQRFFPIARQQVRQRAAELLCQPAGPGTT